MWDGGQKSWGWGLRQWAAPLKDPREGASSTLDQNEGRSGHTKGASISEAHGISGYAPGKFPGPKESPTLSHCLPLPVPVARLVEGNKQRQWKHILGNVRPASAQVHGSACPQDRELDCQQRPRLRPQGSHGRGRRDQRSAVGANRVVGCQTELLVNSEKQNSHDWTPAFQGVVFLELSGPPFFSLSTSARLRSLRKPQGDSFSGVQSWALHTQVPKEHLIHSSPLGKKWTSTLGAGWGES